MSKIDDIRARLTNDKYVHLPVADGEHLLALVDEARETIECLCLFHPPLNKLGKVEAWLKKVAE